MIKEITKIKKLKNKVSIYFDKEKLDLSFNAFTSSYLYVGKKLNENDIKELENNNSTDELFNYALGVINRNQISEWKLREKLYLKDANKGDVDKVINKLKASNLINDKEYALNIYDYLSNKNYGIIRIKEYMNQKGIFEDIINSVTPDYKLEYKKAKNILPELERKYSKYNYNQRKNHIYNSLIQKGFESSICNEMINLIKGKDDKAELELLKKDILKIKNKYKEKYKGKELKDKIVAGLMLKGYKYNDIMKVMD